MVFAGHLRKQAFRNVVIAAPVGGAFGIRELIDEVAVPLRGQFFAAVIQIGGAVYGFHAAAVEFDGGDFLDRGVGGYHGDVGHIHQ